LIWKNIVKNCELKSQCAVKFVMFNRSSEGCKHTFAVNPVCCLCDF
jgi:hypothetical protein